MTAEAVERALVDFGRSIAHHLPGDCRLADLHAVDLGCAKAAIVEGLLQGVDNHIFHLGQDTRSRMDCPERVEARIAELRRWQGELSELLED
jgi:hypothetical protein